MPIAARNVALKFRGTKFTKYLNFFYMIIWMMMMMMKAQFEIRKLSFNTAETRKHEFLDELRLLMRFL